MKKEKMKLLKEVESLLTYHNLSGLTEYPSSSELLDFQVDSQEVFNKPAPRTVSHQQRGEEKHHVLVDKSVSAGINELAEEVENCEGCNLWQKRIGSTPGEGGSSSKLLIVGGWLSCEDTKNGQNKLFGEHEDVMLLKMLQAIHVERSEAFITNVIKCAIQTSVQPTSEHFKACVSYLHRQIRILNPQVICTMGIVATHALLHNTLPLSQLRGRFHSYSLDGAGVMPVMPTYHPSFLLKNPEMKMATWQDLQLIEKKLG